MPPVTIESGRGTVEGEHVHVCWEKDRWTIRWPHHPDAGIHEAFTQITINGTSQTLTTPEWSSAVKAIRVHDALGERRALEVVYTKADVQVVLVASLTPGQSSVILAAQVRNLGEATLELTDFSIFQAAGGLRLGALGDGQEAPAVYVDSGSQAGTHIARLVDTQVCSGICAAYNPVSDLGFVCAYVSFEHDNTITIGPADGSLDLAAKTSTPIKMGPGVRHAYDALLIDCRRSPFEALERYADVVNAVNDPPIPEQLAVGWISWYCYRLTMTEDIVLQNAEVIARHFHKYGVKLVQLDHGWQYKDICGVWEPNEKFPHGLQWLSCKLAAMGLEMGLWIAPSEVSEFAPIATDNPQMLVLSADGRPVVRCERWTWAPHGKTYILDPLSKAGEQFLRDLAKTLNSYGITYLKTDFVCGWDGSRRLRAGMRILRENLNDNILLRPCSTPLNTQLGLAQEIGIARDIGNANGDWPHMRAFTMEVASKWFMHDKFWANSGGCLIVGDPQETLGEAIGRTTLLALTGGAVLLSDKLPELEQQPERLKLVPLCLPPSGIPARPIDLFRVGEPGREYPRIWHLHVQKGWGSWEVIGLFNWTEQPLEETITFTDLGLPRSTEYLIFDFWTQTLVGRFTDTCKLVIPAGAARCLRITPILDHPTVASTDMHITQGLVDLENVRWDDSSLTLSGEAIRAPQAQGTLFIYLPPGYALANAHATETIGPQCVALKVTFASARQKWSLAFQQAYSEKTLLLNPAESILTDPMCQWTDR